jgi:glycosidase
MKERFYFHDGTGKFDSQATLGFGLLFTLLGIPCVYYGTEQGLHGRGNSDQAVREALWGKPGGFDRTHPFYTSIKSLAASRATQPALRYGRLYFRPISGNLTDFGVSPFTSGVVAFSRILNDQEVVVIANTNVNSGFTGEVIVDAHINKDNSACTLLFSNRTSANPPGNVRTRAGGSIRIQEPSGDLTTGPARTVPVNLGPMEIQILRNT